MKLNSQDHYLHCFVSLLFTCVWFSEVRELFNVFKSNRSAVLYF